MDGACLYFLLTNEPKGLSEILPAAAAKANKMTYAPSEDSDQTGRYQISLGSCPVWSVFAVHMKKPCAGSYLLSV